MTTFGYFDLEQTVRGGMVDLPTFDTYSVQYQPPTSMLHCDSTNHPDAVYNATSLQQFGALTPGGDGGSSFGSDHDQVYGAMSSATAVRSLRFWEHGVAPGGSLEPPACAATRPSLIIGYPSSVQWHADYSQHLESYNQPTITTPPRPSNPFQMSMGAAQNVDSVSATQMPPLETSYIPSLLVPSFRHAVVPQPSLLSVGTILNPAKTHLAAHQPVPPECQSTYSTLAGNIEFLEKLRLDRSESRNPSSCVASPSSIESQPQPLVAISSSNKRPRSPSASVPSYPKPEYGIKSVSVLDERSTKASLSGASNSGPDVPDTWIPTKLTFIDDDSSRSMVGPSAVKRARTEDPPASSLLLPSSQAPPCSAVVPEPTSGVPAVTIEEAPPGTKHPKNVKEPRKPSLACLFCRERKIGCGRPPEGSEDMTCNQCARRNFVCVYMAEKPPRVRKRPVKAKLPVM